MKVKKEVLKPMTNEQLAELIKTGKHEELKPVLWEQVCKLLYGIAERYYIVHSQSCNMCGVMPDDLKQAAYTAYIGAINAYDSTKGYKFNTYLTLQFKKAVRPLLGKDVLNSSASLNELVGDENEDTELVQLIADETALDEFRHIYKSCRIMTICEAVNRLPKEERAVIYCRYYKDMNIKAAAHALSINENEVIGLERKALRHLRNDRDMRLLALECRKQGGI
jgi:RNA polymerase sigma factor (sigma-70 family)